MIATPLLNIFRNSLTPLIFLFLSWLWCRNFFSFTQLDSHVMLDGDPALNAWALSWVTKAIMTDWFTLFNGNVFYPHTGSIMLSEHMTGLAIFNIPVRLFTENPWTAYNASIFSAYLLSAWGGYKFITELTHSRFAGCWGGIFWAFCFFRVHHIGHLQILSYQWFPFIALYLTRTIKKPSYRNASLLALFFIFQALTSWYLAVIASFLVLVIFFCYLNPSNWGIKHLSAFTISATLVLIALLPFALAYSNVFRDSSLIDRLTAMSTNGDQVQIADFLYPPTSTFIGSLITNNRYWIWGENTLYIGYTSLFLALIGVRYGWRNNKRMTLSAILIILLGYILALGYSSPSLGIQLPLYYLSQAFPFFGAIRATQRYALLIYFGILILSGFGVIQLLANHQRITRSILVILLSALFLFEVYPYQLPFGQPMRYTPSHLDQEIAHLKLVDGKKPIILHFPIYTTRPAYPTAEAIYMVDSTLHWGKILNGFSGAEPRGFRQDMLILNNLPSEEALEMLYQYDINVLAIHQPLESKQKNEILNYFEKSGRGEIHKISKEEFLVIVK